MQSSNTEVLWISMFQLFSYKIIMVFFVSSFLLLGFDKLVHPLAAFIKYKGLKDNNTYVCIADVAFSMFNFILNPVISYFRVRLLQHESFA